MLRLFKLLPINLRLFDESYISLSSDEPDERGDTGLTEEDGAANSPQQEETGEDLQEGDNDTVPGAQEQEEAEILSLDLKQLTTPEARKQAFSTIKEKFKDEFSEDFQTAFNRRFKDHKQQEQKLADYEPLIDALMEYHNVKDIRDLQRIVEDEVISSLAEQEGFQDPEKYLDYRHTKREASKLKADKEAREAEEKSRRFVDDLISQGTELKKVAGYEDLDLAKELDNPEIVKRLNAGYTLRDALDTVHRDRIIQKQIEAAVKNQLTDIKAKGQKRIPENGYAQGTSGVVRVDVSKLSDKQIEQINERVARGEKITFG